MYVCTCDVNVCMCVYTSILISLVHLLTLSLTNARILLLLFLFLCAVIDAVLKALTEQPKIQRLNLHDNRLEDVSTEKLSTFVSRSCKLRMLDIGKNPELDFTAFFKALQRNRLLQVL